MPSGTWANNDLGDCLMCGKKLRPLYKNSDWKTRKYHVSCFRELVSDISNYNKVAYTKYGVKKKIANMPEEVAKEKKQFTITFD
tara:strand:+ start:126 stop:377 length:252 start_codon:yes stop_codon:yes gene_type:complete